MRGALLIILILVLTSVSVAALTGPVTYNGNQYYVVTSTDPSEDTGNEVCAKAGKACVGYTEESTDVCKQFHSGASETSSLSGDLSGVYCDGAPQTGVCTTATDTCHECPACTNTVDCGTQIGGLYREMYVECAGQCKIQLSVTSVQKLIGQIPNINAQLQGCPQTIPSYAGALIKSGNTVINVLMNNGQTQSFTITIANGKATGVTKGASAKCSQKLTVTENDLANALTSSNIGQAMANLYGSGNAKVAGCGFFGGVRVWAVNLFAKPAAKKIAPTQPLPAPAPNCGQVGEQCNNRACWTGICASPKERNTNGQWGHWNYKCINQNDYNVFCVGQGNTPPAWACLTAPCR